MLFGGSRTRHVVHRLALFDAGGALTNVISQSDVVAFLAGRAAEFEGLAAQSVAELGLVQGTVISVRGRAGATRAFVGAPIHFGRP